MKKIVTGIIISRREFIGDKFYIDILTEETSVIEAVCRISKRKRNNAGIFLYGKFSLESSKKNYYFLESESIYSFHKLSFDAKALTLASYFAYIIKLTEGETHTEHLQKTYVSGEVSTQTKEIFRFFLISLYNLEKRGENDFPLIKAFFELRRARQIGIAPDLVACSICKEFDKYSKLNFSLEEGCIYCSECLKSSFNTQKISVITLPKNIINLMRHAIFSDYDKVFSFPENYNEEYLKSISMFCEVCEKFLLMHIEASPKLCKILDYYRNL